MVLSDLSWLLYNYLFVFLPMVLSSFLLTFSNRMDFLKLLICMCHKVVAPQLCLLVNNHHKPQFTLVICTSFAIVRIAMGGLREAEGPHAQNLRSGESIARTHVSARQASPGCAGPERGCELTPNCSLMHSFMARLDRVLELGPFVTL